MPTATPFNNLITFSRGSNATVTGSNGLIQWAPNNLLTFSESFDAAAWVKTNATVYPNQDFGNGTLGPELVTNGDFATDTAWTKPVNGTISGGSANFAPGGGATANFQQSASGLTNVFVRVQFSVSNFVAGSVALRIGASGGITKTIDAVANGTYSEILQVNGSLTFFQLLGNNSSNLSVDNVSVREITPAAATAPDGTQTADTLFVPATGVQTILTLNPGATLGLPYTASIYVKRVNSDWFALSNQTFFAYFNLSGAGSVGTVGEGSASITSVGDGWFRIAWAGSVAWSTAIRVRAVTADNNPAVVAGQQYLIWGAQLELGSTATTYNPTTVKNLLGFSEAFDNAAWGKTAASMVTGAQANPVNGAFNAQKLMEDTSTGLHYAGQSATTAAAPYTFSCYAKAAGRNFIFLYNPATNISLSVDLTTGATGQASGTVAPTASSAVSLGSGWYRVSMTLTTTAASNIFRLYLGQSLTGTGSYTGDGNSGVYIYGAQLSDSASLDPYVPTPGAAPSSTAFYGPRFDFDPVTLAPRGLLVEEQRTNLATYSDDFGNAAWSKTGGSVTANASASPDGTINADRFVPNTTVGNHSVDRSITTWAAGGTATFSVRLKADPYEFVGLSFYNVPYTGEVRVVPNLTALTVSTFTLGTAPTAVSATIIDAGNGWRVLTVTATFATGTGVNPALVVNPTNSNVFGAPSAGDGTSGILIWGAQLEAGAFATSYIPTLASTVTRSADVATITGQNFAQWFANSEGTFALEANMFSVNTGDRRIIGINNIPAAAAFVSSGAGLGIFDGTIVAASGAVIANTPFKGATAFDSTTKYAVRNGGVVANGARSGTFPITPGSSIQLGFEGGGGNYLNGHIRNIRFIPARAADFQLQGLST